VKRGKARVGSEKKFSAVCFADMILFSFTLRFQTLQHPHRKYWPKMVDHIIKSLKSGDTVSLTKSRWGELCGIRVRVLVLTAVFCFRCQLSPCATIGIIPKFAAWPTTVSTCGEIFSDAATCVLLATYRFVFFVLWNK
jgi:hypothetical protein